MPLFAPRPALILLSALALALAACPAPPVPPDAPDAAAPDAIGDAANDTPAPDDALADTPAAPDGSDGAAGDGSRPGAPCVADNSPAAVAARDGFLEVCADPAQDPQAVCGDGSTYKFSYRAAPAGTSRGLLLFFQGGGACSDYVSCWGRDGRGGAGRTVTTLSNDANTSPRIHPLTGRASGFFDAMEPGNALAGYDVVFGSYCTGDVGLGMREQVFERPAAADPTAPAQIRTYQHGQYNLRVVLDFAHRTFATPARVVVAGTSAGAYTSLFAMPTVVTRYAGVTRFAYLADGGMGIGGAMYETNFDTIVGRLAGGGAGGRVVRFGQVSFQADATQRAFASDALRSASAFQSALRTAVERRARQHPTNYRYFAPPGNCHVILQSPALYQRFVRRPDGTFAPAEPPERPNPDVTLEGVGLDAWIRALVETDGPIGTELRNLAGPWDAVTDSCPLPSAAR